MKFNPGETRFERYCTCLGRMLSRTHVIEAEADMEKSWRNFHQGVNCKDIDQETWEKLYIERYGAKGR